MVKEPDLSDLMVIKFDKRNYQKKRRKSAWQSVKAAKEKDDVRAAMEAARTACLKLARCVTETADAQFATAKAFSLSSQT